MNQPMQEVAEKFEAAYIQNGGLLLAVQYDPDSDFYYKNPEYEGLREEEHQGVVDDVNCFYEGFKLALKTVAVQSIEPRKQPTVVHLGQGKVGINQGACEDRYALMFVNLDSPVAVGQDLESNIELQPEEIQVAIKIDNLESLKVLKHQLSCLEANMKLEREFLIIDKNTGEVIKTIEPVIVPPQLPCGESQNPCIPCYTDNRACAGNPKDGGALPNNQGEYPEGTQYTKYDDNHSQNNNNTLRAYKHTGTQWEYYAPLEKQWKWSVLNLLNTPPEVYASLIPVQTGLPDPTTLAGTEPLNISK